MRGSIWRALVPTALVGVAVLAALAGCTDEKKVFVERPIYHQPPGAAQGFLGYDQADKKLTVCGNCHVGVQAKWEKSLHANAWDDLQASGHASAACENCHSVGPNGNSATDGGYASTGDARYFDVQCESCHGPGLNHVTNPDATQPLASIQVALVTAGDTTFVGCGECHNGVHNPFVEEWVQSAHAFPEPTPAGRAECISCHTAQGILAAWNEDDNYQEKDAPLGQQQGIVCAVCHDPHGSSYEGQLRFPLNSTDPNTQLCMKCHQRNSQPDLTSTTLRGPHSPEGPLLLGDAGWWPPGYQPSDRISGTHGSSANPRLCATCHVFAFDVTDASTGAFKFHATGHLFQAIPCIGSDGLPTVGDDCEVDQRYFGACATSGCHGTPDAARSAYLTAVDRIDNLTGQLDGMLTQVGLNPGASSIALTGGFEVKDGAWFNSKLAHLPGTPVHNPFLTEQLLIATIKAMQDTYGLSAPVVQLDRELE